MFRKLFLAALILLVLAGAFWIVRTSQEYRNTAQLADGRVLRVELMTFGTNHYFDPRPNWKQKLSKVIPPSLDRYLGPQKFGPMITPDKALGVFTSLFDPKTEQYVRTWIDAKVCLVDDHGCVLSGFVTGGSGYGNIPVKDALFYNFPAGSKSFQFCWTDMRTGSSANFRIRNPSFGPFPVWQPETLPASRVTNGMTFTLKGIKVTKQKFYIGKELEACFYAPEILVTRNNSPVEDWVPEGYRFFDPAGSSGDNLCTSVSAWKLQVPFYRKAEATFSNDEIFRLSPTPVPKPGEVTVLAERLKGSDMIVHVAAFCGPGRYVWSNDVRIASMAIDSPNIVSDTRSQVFSGGNTRTEVTRSQSFLWLKTSRTDSATRLRIRGTDNLGRAISNRGDEPIGDHWHAETLKVSDGATMLNLEVIPVRPIQIEFIVPVPGKTAPPVESP